MAEVPPQPDWDRLWRGYHQIKWYVITMLVIITIIMLFYLDARINGHVFLSLNESRLERFHVSFGFQFAIMNIIEDMVY